MQHSTVSRPRSVRSLAAVLFRTIAPLFTLLALAASPAAAQGIPGSLMHMSATTKISAAVRPILTLAEVQIASVQNHPAESVVESRVLVRGNMPYRLAVRAAAVLNAEQGTVLVRDETGAWVPLSNDRPVVVGIFDPGVTTHAVSCRVVAASASAAGATVAAPDAQSCSLSYELSPRSDAAVLAAVAVLPVQSTASGAEHD